MTWVKPGLARHRVVGGVGVRRIWSGFALPSEPANESRPEAGTEGFSTHSPERRCPSPALDAGAFARPFSIGIKYETGRERSGNPQFPQRRRRLHHFKAHDPIGLHDDISLAVLRFDDYLVLRI